MGRLRRALRAHVNPDCQHPDLQAHRRSRTCDTMATNGPPELPTRWFFYNLRQSIDDPYKAFSAAVLDSTTSRVEVGEPGVHVPPGSLPETTESRTTATEPDSNASHGGWDCKTLPLFSRSTIRRTISPLTEWTAFSPSDTARLNQAKAASSPDPVAVGHERLLFEVHEFSRLRPIYWQIAYSTMVTGAHWVFSDTLTPIDPEWDAAIVPHFQNFVANLDAYRETLEQAQSADPTVMDAITQRVVVQQMGHPLSLELLFSPLNNSVYVFKAQSGYTATKQAASCMLTGTTPRGVICVLRAFDFADYKQLYSLPDRPNDDPEYEPLPVNNLIMVFHGVGQKLSNSYTRVNFVYAIDKLRVEILKATDTPEVYSHFPQDGEDPKKNVRNLVLAVNWRSAFDAEQIPDLSDITVPSLPMLRQGFNDALLDIPLYMSENRRPAMLKAAAGEANRLYDLVVKHHPSFIKHGRTHLVGHSLGALITGDLLTHQPTQLDASTIADAPLKFQTFNYFTTGSMLGVFLRLKGQTIVPREEYLRECVESERKDDPQTRPLGCFAVRNLYNISNQLDLLSFLLNCTVRGGDAPAVGGLSGPAGLRLEADELPTPSPDKAKAEEEAEEKEKTPEENSSPSPPRSRSFSSLGKFFSRFKSEVTETTEEIVDPQDYPPEVTSLLKRMQTLNDNGQLDFKLPQLSSSYLPSHLLKLFTAHFDYWSNKEIARFLAIECGRVPGPEHTLPAHRAKWTLKKNNA